MLEAIALVIALAHDHSIETRIRCLVAAHQADGDQPRTLVMNAMTWVSLAEELEGCSFTQDYFWIPGKKSGKARPLADPNAVTFYLGMPILIKEFVADMEILVGV